MQETAQKKSIQISIVPGTQNPCSKYKWGRKEAGDLKTGFCDARKNKDGTVWVRKIRDFDNTTCGRYEEGVPGLAVPSEIMCSCGSPLRPGRSQDFI
ncbi:MAG TPA: hypothetical protein DCK76_00120 [Desulfotomaculum sp.]|nr:MAG: Putative benzylsuccinate synthase beta subunit [Parcubacteria bacterium 33_209]HAG09826.1 hypothetical protein [Desulfotomaculum sp.]HBY03307.1 hypothetical protein [Desulfotomaculum sp.]